MTQHASRRGRFRVSAVAGLLTVALVTAPCAAQAGFDRDRTRISDARADYRQPFVIHGRVVDTATGDLCTAGTTTVRRDPAAAGRTRLLGTDRHGGRFRFELTATSTADYVLDYSGGHTAGCGIDRGVLFQRVYRAMPSRVSDGGTMRGAVLPGWRRKPVLVQVRRDGRWASVARVRTDRRGRYSARLRDRPGRVTRYRAVVRATTAYARSVSTTWSIR